MCWFIFAWTFGKYRQHEPKHLQLPCCVFFFLLCRPTHREQALLKASLSTPISSVQPMCRYIQSDLTMRGLWSRTTVHRGLWSRTTVHHFLDLTLTTTRIARWKERHQERDVSGSLTWQLAHGWQSTVDASAGWTQKVEWVLPWFCMVLLFYWPAEFFVDDHLVKSHVWSFRGDDALTVASEVHCRTRPFGRGTKAPWQHSLVVSWVFYWC